MGQASVTANQPLLRRMYGSKVSEPIWERSALARLASKDTNFVGDDRAVTVVIADTAGGSANFADAVASQEATVERRFVVRRKTEYQVFTISNELILASKGTGGIVDALKLQMDRARNAFAGAIARRLWSAGGGSIGQLHSGVNLASTTLSLRGRTDIVGVFDINRQLEFASDNGTATNPAGRRGAPDQLKVAKLNTDNASLTTTALLNTVNGLTVNDFVFRRGDYANTASGLPGWVPITDPTGGDSFNGVDRTDQIQKLSGSRTDGAGKSFEETLQDAGYLAAQNNAKPTHCFINHDQYRGIVKELGSKVVISDGKGVIGMKTITIHLSTGAVELVPEAFVPSGYAWLGDPSEFVIASLGEMPQLLNDGSKNGMKYLEGSDSWQGRFGAYWNTRFNDSGVGPSGWTCLKW